MLSAALLFAAGLLTSDQSQALAPASFSVSIKSADGMPVRDAVITVTSANGATPSAIKFAWANSMSQQDIAFNPGTLIVPRGATVSFPNRDKVRHNIYSFSKISKFDFKLYGRDESKNFTFNTVGNAALGCNIHDQMRGYIKVVDTPYAGKTDINGRLMLANLPSGTVTVKIWHPQMRARGNEISQTISLTAGAANSRSFNVDLR